MPPVIAAAAVSVAGSAGVALGATAASVIGQVGFGLALAGASTLLAPPTDAQKFDPAAADQSFLADNEGRKITVRQAVPQRRFIYGRALVSGPMFFLEKSNPHIYMGIILADGPIDAIEELRIAGQTVQFDASGNATTLPYRDGSNIYLSLSFRPGTDDQAIDPILAADWPALPPTFRQRGVATVVLKLHYGTDRDHHETLWPAGDINPLFLVRGQRVYDSRAVAQSPGDSTTWKWSSNPSLCLNHYLTNKWRRPVSQSEIDTAALKTAADIDDESVGLLSGSFETRHTCNGVVKADGSDFAIVEKLLTANNGRVVFRSGKYVINAAAPKVPSLTLTDADIKGPLSVRYAAPVRETTNTVRTIFTAPDREYQTANGPVVSDAAFITADGRTNDATLELPMTGSPSTAQRLSKQVMLQNRSGKQISTRLGDIAHLLQAGDIVTADLTTLPLANGTYSVEQADFSADGVDVVLREYSASIFAWDPATDEQAFTIAPAEL